MRLPTASFLLLQLYKVDMIFLNNFDKLILNCKRALKLTFFK